MWLTYKKVNIISIYEDKNNRYLLKYAKKYFVNFIKIQNPEYVIWLYQLYFILIYDEYVE